MRLVGRHQLVHARAVPAGGRVQGSCWAGSARDACLPGDVLPRFAGGPLGAGLIFFRPAAHGASCWCSACCSGCGEPAERRAAPQACQGRQRCCDPEVRSSRERSTAVPPPHAALLSSLLPRCRATPRHRDGGAASGSRRSGRSGTGSAAIRTGCRARSATSAPSSATSSGNARSTKKIVNEIERQMGASATGWRSEPELPGGGQPRRAPRGAGAQAGGHLQAGPLHTFQALLAAETFGDLLSRYKYLYLPEPAGPFAGRGRPKSSEPRRPAARRAGRRAEELDPPTRRARQRAPELSGPGRRALGAPGPAPQVG